MNLVYGKHHRLNTLLRLLKKVMVLILSLVYQKIGTSKAMLKRKVLIRIMEMFQILKVGNLLSVSLKIRCQYSFLKPVLSHQ